MTVDEVKEYLMKAYRLDKLIQIDKDEIDRLRVLSTCYGGADNSEKVQISPKLEAKYTKYVEELADKEAKLRERILENEKILFNISNAIHTLEDNLEIEILMYRYVKYLSFYQIAESTNYSRSKVYRIHDEALEKLSKSISI